MKTTKLVIFNILGTIIGIIASDVTFIITEWIFVDLLGRFKLLTMLLSSPVGYDTYAFTGIIIAVAAASLYSCAFICKFSRSNFNFGCLLVGLYNIFVYEHALITSISTTGFNLDLIWMIVVVLGTFGIFSFMTAANKEV